MLKFIPIECRRLLFAFGARWSMFQCILYRLRSDPITWKRTCILWLTSGSWVSSVKNSMNWSEGGLYRSTTSSMCRKNGQMANILNLLYNHNSEEWTLKKFRQHVDLFFGFNFEVPILQLKCRFLYADPYCKKTELYVELYRLCVHAKKLAFNML